MAFSLGEYQDIFLEEADEQLQELNQNLLELEKNPEDLDIINNIFRAAHSLKSSAAFVGLNDLSDLAHKMENLLQGIRDKTMDVSTEVIDIIFKCFDEISVVIDSISSGEEPKQDLTGIINEIQALSDRNISPGASSSNADVKGSSSAAPIPKTTLESEERKRIKRSLDSGERCIEITVHIDDQAQMKWVKAQLVLSNLSKLGEILKTIPSTADLNDDSMDNIFKVILLSNKDLDNVKNACNIDLVTKIDIKSIQLTKKNNKVLLKFGEAQTFSAMEMVENEERLRNESRKSSSESEKSFDVKSYGESVFDEDDEMIPDVSKSSELLDQDRRKISSLKTVKVSVDKLDQLLNNVAELVIANSGYYKLFDEIRKNYDDKSITNEFKNRMEQMARIAKDLQTGIMKTRMVPIGQVFTRFNRLVRDLKKEFKKDIELIVKGEDTELDKKVIDAIGEPLLHLIRNAIDHGIESADERKAIGKPLNAHITLNAYQGGNQIFVEVSDDGRGINIEDVKREILDKGIATIEQLSAMDNTEIYDFIFTPGFSTAKVVTDISGRGVGMNVVKEIVNELNGNVLIETELGMGTRFVLSFPLTLAIIPAIMVKIRKEIYAIPLSDVIETIKITNSDITTIEGHEVINLRGEILSLLRLSDFVGIRSGLKKKQRLPVVVVGFGNRKIGLIVDILEGKQEIVIKSLEQNYQTVEGLAGASILGDGSICLILDISSMINKVISEQDKISSLSRYKVEEVRNSLGDEFDDEEDEDEDEDKDELDGFEDSDSMDDIFKEEDEDAFGGIVSESDQTFEQESFDDENVEVGVVSSTKDSSLAQMDQVGEKLDDPYMSVKSEDLSDVDSTSKIHSEIEPVVEDIEIIPDEDDDEDDSSAAIIREPKKEFPEPDTEIKKRVHTALEEFKKELKENVKTTLVTGKPGDQIEKMLNINENSMQEFQIIANIGAANSAESLSKILNKRIDLSIPEITLKPTTSIPDYIGKIDSIYIGVMMPIQGDLKGSILLVLNEDIGFELIDLLYGTGNKAKMKLDEDGGSALKELLNIVGSSILNVFADKIGMVIKPDIPTIVHDYLQSILDSILVSHKMANEYTIIMDTAFYFESDKIIGNLLLLPEMDSLKIMLEKLGSNV